MLAFRGIEVSHETIRQWAFKFGQEFANIIRRRLSRPGDTWHLDEVVPRIAGKTHYLWRAVGPGRHRAGRPGPEPAQQEGGQAAAAQAAEAAVPGAARPDHGQAALIRRGEEGDPAGGTARRALPEGPSTASTRGSTTGQRTHTSQQGDANGR